MAFDEVQKTPEEERQVMTIKNLLEIAKGLGAEDYNLCLSQFVLVDKNEEITGVADVPVHGIAHNHENKELRLVIVSDDFEQIAKLLGDKAKIRYVIKDE
jgi:hypothetical protein